MSLETQAICQTWTQKSQAMGCLLASLHVVDRACNRLEPGSKMAGRLDADILHACAVQVERAAEREVKRLHAQGDQHNMQAVLLDVRAQPEIFGLATVYAYKQSIRSEESPVRTSDGPFADRIDPSRRSNRSVPASHAAELNHKQRQIACEYTHRAVIHKFAVG